MNLPTLSHPFSYSSLSTFEQCPVKYKFYYLDKIEKKEESIETYLGRRVHETMEFIYKKVQLGNPPHFDTVIKNYQSRWEKNWHSHLVIVNPLSIPSDYNAIGLRCLAWYYRTYFPFYEPVEKLEAEMLFKIDGDDNYLMKGIADRLDYHGDGIWEIHDYKTSKRTMTQKGVDRDRQLALYHMGLLQNEENVKEVRLVWHFMREGITLQSKRTSIQLSQLGSIIKTEIDFIKRTISHQGPFPPKETPLCYWCYYWVECPVKIGNNPFVKN